MDPVKPGARLRCEVCGTEVVVIKADDDVRPVCCGKPLSSPVKS
jgi:hypothetical protein